MSGVLASLKRLRADYRVMLKAPEMEETLDALFFRPLAYLSVLVLKPTAITADQVTIASIVVGVAAGVFFGIGTQASLLWGAAAVFLFNVLDCADGMLARIRGQGSPFGYVLDGLAGYIGTAAIVLGLGQAAAARHANPLFWWLLTVAAGLSLAWWCAVVDGLRLEWARRVYGKRQDRAAELAKVVETAAVWEREGTHGMERMLAGAYVIYVRLWEGRATRERAEGPAIPESPEDSLPVAAWAEVNRPILRLAVAAGPTMQLVAVMVAAAFNRPEWLLWGAVVAGNLYGGGVLLARGAVRRRLLAQSAAGA
jgi:phosphatidylglycerophosphate synthase